MEKDRRIEELERQLESEKFNLMLAKDKCKMLTVHIEILRTALKTIDEVLKMHIMMVKNKDKESHENRNRKYEGGTEKEG